jgi:hypothetical protein
MTKFVIVFLFFYDKCLSLFNMNCPLSYQDELLGIFDGKLFPTNDKIFVRWYKQLWT